MSASENGFDNDHGVEAHLAEKDAEASNAARIARVRKRCLTQMMNARECTPQGSPLRDFMNAVIILEQLE